MVAPEPPRSLGRNTTAGCASWAEPFHTVLRPIRPGSAKSDPLPRHHPRSGRYFARCRCGETNPTALGLGPCPPNGFHSGGLSSSTGHWEAPSRSGFRALRGRLMRSECRGKCAFFGERYLPDSILQPMGEQISPGCGTECSKQKLGVTHVSTRAKEARLSVRPCRRAARRRRR